MDEREEKQESTRDSEIRMEQETHLRYDRTDDPATLFTAHKINWERIQKAGFKPTEINHDRRGKVVGMVFEIPRGQISLKISTTSGRQKDPKLTISTKRRAYKQNPNAFGRKNAPQSSVRSNTAMKPDGGTPDAASGT